MIIKPSITLCLILGCAGFANAAADLPNVEQTSLTVYPPGDLFVSGHKQTEQQGVHQLGKNKGGHKPKPKPPISRPT